jgi:hypothetical protein
MLTRSGEAVVDTESDGLPTYEDDKIVPRNIATLKPLNPDSNSYFPVF